MEKTPQELLKAYVDSQKFSSTTEIMKAMKEMFRDVLQQVMESELDTELVDHLELDWRREFSLEELSACCERMENLLPGTVVSDKNAQRELIENPAFAAYLSKLLALLPEEPEKQPEQRPVYDYNLSVGTGGSANAERYGCLIWRKC